MRVGFGRQGFRRRGMSWAWMVLAAVFLGCQRERATAHAEMVKLPVTQPLRSDTELTKQYVAQIHAIQRIELRALKRGYLQGIFVDEGQRIAKNTTLFQILPLIYQAELQKASAEAELTDIECNNTKNLAEKKGLGQRIGHGTCQGQSG